MATLNANSVKKKKDKRKKWQYLGGDKFTLGLSGIAAARLEKDIFVRTHLHTARIVVRMTLKMKQ